MVAHGNSTSPSSARTKCPKRLLQKTYIPRRNSSKHNLNPCLNTYVSATLAQTSDARCTLNGVWPLSAGRQATSTIRSIGHRKTMIPKKRIATCFAISDYTRARAKDESCTIRHGASAPKGNRRDTSCMPEPRVSVGEQSLQARWEMIALHLRILGGLESEGKHMNTACKRN